MKRCPNCNRTFDEDWLSFCTTDGTALLEVSQSREPPPTIRATGVNTTPTGQPTFDLPGSYAPPPVSYAAPTPPAQSWQPPAPPVAYTASPKQGLAMASFVLGLVSILVGWCCYFGVLTAPTSIIMGIIALSQIKDDPKKYGGKPLAIIGIATSSLFFLGLIMIILVWGFGILIQGISH